MADTLKEKTTKGLFWGALNSGTTQVLNLLIGIMLGRLLSPGEYGIIGYIAIFTAATNFLSRNTTKRRFTKPMFIPRFWDCFT